MQKKIAIAIGLILALLAIFFVFIPSFSGKLQIDPEIHLGIVNIRWYGLTLALGVLVSWMIARANAWRFGIAAGSVDDYAFWAVIIGIVGARIYHVLFNLSYYSANLSETYKIWHGGLSIYGGILAGLIFTYFYTRNKAFGFSQIFDLISLALPLGQAVGRLGNFFNQEAFGLPTNLPWKMYVAPAHRPQAYMNNDFFHPTFLYELFYDIFVFLVLYKLLGKTKPYVLGLSYLALYSFGRFFIESIRLDSFYVLGFKIDQIVAFLLIIICGSLIFKIQLKKA